MVSETNSHYDKYIETPDALVSMLVEKDREIVKLQRILSNLQKTQFGVKSEKLSVVSDNQIPLLGTEVSAPELPKKKVTVPAHTRAARVKRDLSKLPHVRVVHEPYSKNCSCCGDLLSKVGEDISKELNYIPAKLYITEHVRPRYGCSRCKERILQAALPDNAKPLNKSIAGASLLSQVLVSKYVDHLPLHRQERIFARKGLEIPRKNLCDWIGGVVSEYFTRLWKELKKELLAESYLQADETTMKVQDPEVQKRCHTGYLWEMYGPEKRAVLFEYAESRAGAVAEEIFEGYKGALQTDLYAGYNKVLLPGTVSRIACLAHVRRKFIEAEKSCSKEATTVLSFISELYRLERAWEGLSPPERKAERDAYSKPIFLKLEGYLRELRERTLPKAPLMEAINYTLTQWNAIFRILDDGRFHLDNNSIEREMRPIALGRKNYLFAGSHEGAKRAAIIYSLFGTAQLHQVNPLVWTQDVLERMRGVKTSEVHLLLPHHWKLARA